MLWFGVVIPESKAWRAAKINLTVVLWVRAISKAIRMPERASMIHPSSDIWAQDVVVNKAITADQYRI